MIERRNFINSIIEKLTYLSMNVKVSNSIKLTDLNIISETFYQEFLNLLYGYNLKNINIENPNAAAIDLGDEVSKIAIQVTSTKDLAKIRKTIKSFNEKDLHKKYDRLVVLNIVAKSNHQDENIGDATKLQINTKSDVWDISDLIKTISALKTPELKNIADFFAQEVNFKEDKTLAKEVKTFLSLIEYLSDESQPSAGTGFIEAPDPDGKINTRFSDYADFLKNEYKNLYVEYGAVLADVMKLSDMGFTRIRRLGLHLKNYSDKVLTEHNGNAKQALEAIIKNYMSELSKNGSEYDESAVRFFLVDQLIKCNVFPNKVVTNV